MLTSTLQGFMGTERSKEQKHRKHTALTVSPAGAFGTPARDPSKILGSVFHTPSIELNSVNFAGRVLFQPNCSDLSTITRAEERLGGLAQDP